VIIHAAQPKRDFTVIPNRVLRDDALSYRARGLLAYLLSQPPGWQISSGRLAIKTGEGRDAVRTALRELMCCGYLDLKRRQGDRGLWEAEYTVTDTPWYFDYEPVDNSGEPVDNWATGA
jgi:hypothetical protein